MAPDEAYAAAKRAPGNAALTKEAARTISIAAWWDHFLLDLRYGVRFLRRAPAAAPCRRRTIAQRLPFHHGHDNVQESARVARVVDRQDVGMIQPSGELDFPQKAVTW